MTPDVLCLAYTAGIRAGSADVVAWGPVHGRLVRFHVKLRLKARRAPHQAGTYFGR